MTFHKELKIFHDVVDHHIILQGITKDEIVLTANEAKVVHRELGQVIKYMEDISLRRRIELLEAQLIKLRSQSQG